MLKQKPQDSSFQDGIVKVYRVENVAEPGNMPVKKPVLKYKLRYRRRTVGMQRYYTAKEHAEKIDELIRCQAGPKVQTSDIAELPDGKYIIRQVQYPENAAFPVMDLALERLEA